MLQRHLITNKHSKFTLKKLYSKITLYFEHCQFLLKNFANIIQAIDQTLTNNKRSF